MRTESLQNFASRSASLRWLEYHRYSVISFLKNAMDLIMAMVIAMASDRSLVREQFVFI
jgi:hypothetical protein